MKEPKVINNFRHNAEREWFGVLTRYGTKLGIPVSKLRVFYLFNVCNRGYFLSFLPWFSIYALGERLYRDQAAKRF